LNGKGFRLLRNMDADAGAQGEGGTGNGHEGGTKREFCREEADGTIAKGGRLDTQGGREANEGGRPTTLIRAAAPWRPAQRL